MGTEQASLFDQRKYRGIAGRAHQIELPAGDHSVVKTLPAYYAYLQSGGYSTYTPADFTSDIKKFGAFVKNKPLASIQTTDIQQWIGALKKTMTAKTVSRKLAALNNYFVWLEGQGVVTHTPMQSIMRTRVTSPLPEVLFEQEARQLRVAASRDPRAYLLVLLLLETGMKKAELFTLKTTHFDFSDAYAPEVWIKHTGKQVAKDRKLKLPPEIVSVFRDYVQRYSITDTLFPYTPRLVELVLADTGERAGLQKKVTASLLRDTFVVLSIKRGGKLEDVLKKIGLTEATWDDARKKYVKLTAAGL